MSMKDNTKAVNQAEGFKMDTQKDKATISKQEYIELVSNPIKAIENKRNWASLPLDIQALGIKQAKKALRPFWTGNTYIKSRCLLAKAESFQDIYKAIEVSYEK